MRTQGEIEAAICEGITRFEQEYRGRGPRDIRAYLLGGGFLHRSLFDGLWLLRGRLGFDGSFLHRLGRSRSLLDLFFGVLGVLGLFSH